MRTSLRDTIPTIILTGFLGAGKTTWLNRLLQEGVPDNSLVVVNDFGQINIDASLIAYQDDKIVRLNNGCVCCTLGGSMAEKLAEISRMQPAPGALYMEVSGVANAGRVADMVRVSSRLRLQDIWCFVDVSQAQRYSEDSQVNTVWRQQIQSATQLVLNRYADRECLPAALGTVLKTSEAVLHYDTHTASDEIAFSAAITPTPLQAGGWHSCTIESRQPIVLSSLLECLEEWAAVLYRVKGRLIDEQDGKAYVLHYTGGQCRLTPCDPPPAMTQLVFIASSERALQIIQQQIKKTSSTP
ncbi:CobW family GTP-binding protein [Paenalcaligenes sp. Me52]|uniref:CobW family GTP-binding protein n=1 Tax=Paenalcaligenes sp. Me52 TaxID=3392038 RepID=UPI003D2AFA38